LICIAIPIIFLQSDGQSRLLLKTRGASACPGPDLQAVWHALLLQP